MKVRKTTGFGYDEPTQWCNYFKVVIDRNRVQFFHILDHPDPLYQYSCKATLSLLQWAIVQSPAEVELNRRILELASKVKNLPYQFKQGRWKKQGEVAIEPFLGKELMVLIWAIELTFSPLEIQRALVNWQQLSPEERWWLYTTTNATYLHIDHAPDRGWRKALKVALIEN